MIKLMSMEISMRNCGTWLYSCIGAEGGEDEIKKAILILLQ